MIATDPLAQYWPLLVLPLVIIQLGLILIALRDLLNRPTTRGPKWMWIAIIIFVNLIGPVLYFVVGREED